MIGFFTGILLFGAAGTTLAACVVSQRRLVAQLASRFRALPRAQQALLVFAVGALVAWAGTKPEGKGEIIELSNNRIIGSVGSRVSRDRGGLEGLVGRGVPDAPQSVGSRVPRDRDDMVGRISPERSSPCEARSLEVCGLDAPQDETNTVAEVALALQGQEGLEGQEGRETGEERSRLEVEAENGTVNLLSPPQASTSTSSPPSTSTSLLFSVPRGRTMPLYLRADATLSVSFTSDDFAFGTLPDLAASRLVGRINFPNVTATTPCFHDYTARRKEVTLPVGADADANKFDLWRS